MKHHLISSQSWKKLLLPVLVAGSLLALPVSTRATLPNTGSGNLTVIFGSATYNNLGNGTVGNLNVTTTTPNTVLGWVSFSDGSPAGGSLAAGDVLNFILPSSTSAVLSQVTGGAATVLNGGTITSNGRVVLLNPTGITINNGTSISTASFYATTVPEPLAYFETNGIPQVFTSTPPATVTSGAMVVGGGVQLATIGGTGTVGFAGNTVSIGGAAATVVNGNLYLESQGGAINVSAGAGTLTVGSATAGGNLTIVSNGGNVDLANGSNTTIYGTATINTSGVVANGGVVDTNSFFASTAGTLSTINAGTGGTGGVVNLTSADFASIGVIGRNVVISDPTGNNIAIGTSTINGTLSVTSTGGSIANTGAVTDTTGAISLQANTAGKSITFSTSGNVSFGAINSTGAKNSVTITGTGNLTFGATVTSPTVSITTTGGNYSDSGVVASTQETVSASGNVVLAAEAALNPSESITSTGGSITQGGALNITTGTFTAPTITLTTPTNTIGTAILIGGGGSSATPVQLQDAVATLTIGNGTNVTGAALIQNNGVAGVGGITFGAASGDTISFGSTLGLTSGATSGTIASTSKNINVTGAVSANTTNSAITLGVAGSTNTNFGQISGTSGTALFTINETGSTNLGTITTTGGLAVTSAGNIVNTGGLIVTASGGVTLSAGSAAAPGSIQVGASGAPAVIPGQITLGFASGLTLWDMPGAAVTVSTNATTTETVATEAIWITDSSNLTVNGGADFGTLSYNVQNGSVTVTDPASLILTNLVDPATNGVNISNTATTGSITLGSGINLLGSGGLVSFTATGSGGAVVDTANSPSYIIGNVAVNAKSIGINNNTANSWGQVALTSSGSIAYTEGQTANIGSISATGSSGTVAISSVSGNIVQGAGATAISINPGYTGASFSAPTGQVQLTVATNSIASSAPIAVTANGGTSVYAGSVIDNNAATVLGNVVENNGTFTLTTLASGGTVTQASGTSIFEYGTMTVTADGAKITLANAGNNFGGLTLDSTDAGATAAGAAVSVRETGTNNYISVKTGTALTSIFTATDDTANIIETGNLGIIAGGGASFTAKSGSITLNATGNSFNGKAVLLSTGSGNAAITDSFGALVFADGTNVGGNLTATETGANGTITDSGALSTVTVGGTFAILAPKAGTGSITFVGDASTFGSVEVQAGSGTSSLLDNANLVLVPGTVVNGPITLTSSGNITTSGVGGSNYNSTLELVANGSIVITNPTYITGGLSVDAIAGPTNLSFLSILSNLNGIKPTNLGNASNYTGASP
ncbi:MAG: filamentous hemagglutinin N-terminal domain-containing protein [Opitutaceae bacterium]